MKSLSPLEPEPEIAPALEVPAQDPPAGGPAREPQPTGAENGHGVKYSNRTHCSTSALQARLYRKGNTREAKLCYLMHDLLGAKSRLDMGPFVCYDCSSARIPRRLTVHRRLPLGELCRTEST